MKLIQQILFGGIFILILISCSSNKSGDFTEISPDLYFQLYTIGEEKEKIKIGDYITVHFKYKTISDSIFFEGFRKFRIQEQKGPGSIIPALLMLYEGDSAGVKINTSDFFNHTIGSDTPGFLNSDSYIFIDMKISEIQSNTDFEMEKSLFIQWVEEFHTSESKLIADYMAKEEIKLSPTESGLYFVSLRKGNGTKVQAGKRVWIHYIGRFLNGRFVDNTNSVNNPVDYVFGTEMFLIEGLEEALSRMYEHEKALVIIPSKLAFGSFGTANEVVPPYTTLIYELEVLKVE